MPLQKVEARIPAGYVLGENLSCMINGRELIIRPPAGAAPGKKLLANYDLDAMLRLPFGVPAWATSSKISSDRVGILKNSGDVIPGQLPPVELAIDTSTAQYIFLDLENLAFLATYLHKLSSLCKQLGVVFRSYTAPGHDWADRATHHARSNQKEAADVRMVIDATRILESFERSRRSVRILLITDDQFGKTFEAEQPENVSCVGYSKPLPTLWLGTVFGEHSSVEEFFQGEGVVRERRGRSASQSANSSRSQSREPSQSREHSLDSRTRASWSRVASEEFSSPTPKDKRTQDHLIQKINQQRKDMDDLRHELSLQKRLRERAEQQNSQLSKQPWNESEALAAAMRLRQLQEGRDAERARASPTSPRMDHRRRDRRSDRRRRTGPRRWPQDKQPSAGKVIGNVKFFDAEKGFGFVSVPGYEKDVFVHRTAIRCDGEPDGNLKNWDIELRVMPDRKFPGKLRGEDVTGPDGQSIPLHANSVGA